MLEKKDPYVQIICDAKTLNSIFQEQLGAL